MPPFGVSLFDCIVFARVSIPPRQPEGSFGNLAVLVYEKSGVVRRKIFDLLSDDTWIPVVSLLSDAASEARLMTAVTKLTLHVLCDFDRRVTTRLESMPYLLLWLAYSSPTEECQSRLRVVTMMLNTDDEILHRTAVKIKRVFRKELDDCLGTNGRLSSRLYSPMRIVANEWKADTQEIEGIMNLIKLASHASNTISAQLMDARVGNRKDVGLGSRSAIESFGHMNTYYCTSICT
jgi:hypothetical protein